MSETSTTAGSSSGRPTEAESDAEPEPEPESDPEAEAEEDAEEVGSEWHVWLLAVIVMAGIVLFFAPRFFQAELLTSLGALLVVVGVLGWIVKHVIEWSA